MLLRDFLSKIVIKTVRKRSKPKLVDSQHSLWGNDTTTTILMSTNTKVPLGIPVCAGNPRRTVP